MIDYEKELNSEQMEVVMAAGGPMLVIAGAGSGKTRALTYRVARLIQTGVPPGQIFLATFTNKASQLMLSRVAAILGKPPQGIWGGTFHHICHRILRVHAGQAGLASSFTILDSTDARSLIAACMEEINPTLPKSGLPRVAVVESMINLARKLQKPVARLIEDKYPYFQEIADLLELAAQLYEQKKRALQMVDFEDLLELTNRLFQEHPEVARYYGEKFHHVLVDEYQDTDLTQAEIVDALAARYRNLMVVGDDAQSIYAFRGAHYANILEFPKRYPDCRIFRLEANYRSTQEILNLANCCIENNARQMKKNLWSIRGVGIVPVVAAARDVTQQAEFVSQRVRELRNEGIPLAEIAVLYRAHYQSMELQLELNRRRIPFVVMSGMRFFEQAHVKDVLAFLRIAANGRDEMAWKRILGLYPKVGPKTAEKICRKLILHPSPQELFLQADFLAAVPALSREGIRQCQQSLRALGEAGEGLTIPELIYRFIDTQYRRVLLERFPDPEPREEDLRQLAELALSYTSLTEFLSHLALQTNSDEPGYSSTEAGNGGDRLILSTLHQAKGKEWSAVIIIWCADGMFPLGRALKEPGGEEEERRLFYVGVTRAKDHLYLVYPVMNYDRQRGYVVNCPSRFISEIAEMFPGPRNSLFERWQLEY